MDTILLLLGNVRDRELLVEHLGAQYRLLTIQPDRMFDLPFDLCIIDGLALNQYRDALAARRAQAETGYLPVLLVTAKRDVGLLTAGIWHVIDEVITSPILKAELHARVEVLLRARRLSLELALYKSAELQRTHHSLAESEAIQRAIIGCSPLAIYSLDLDGYVLTWNPSAERTFGWAAHEVLGTILPIVDEDQRGEFFALMQRIVTGENISGLELLRRRKDGSQIECSLYAAPIRDHEQRIFGVMATMEDITQRKAAERELASSEARFRSLFENNHAVMLVIDPQDGRIFDANPAASKYYGWRREELLGMHINDINTLTPEQISLEMQRAHGQNRVHFEFRHRRSDGSVQDVEVYSGPIMLQGREMLYSLVFDITTRKRTEEALIHSHELLRYIIEHDHNSVAVYDRDLRYIYVSERFRKEYRIQDTDIIGRYHYDVFPDVPLKWREAHQRALAGEVLSADEDMFDRLDGRVDWVRWECRPWYEADGSIGGIILYTEVITERKQLEEQLRQAQKMESIGHLAGGVAHDFNNILAIILIQTELALMKIRHDDPLSARLQEIRKAAERSANLTRQLLAFARKQTISPAVLNLNETVTEMLKMLRRLIGEDIDLTWLPGDQVWSVNIDPSQMDQILANLCVNARDAITGIGQVIIETANVTIQKGDYIALTEAVSGDFVLLTVSDNGRGMDKATLARIFEPFFTTKEIGHGTGLGLATVYGIVKQNGGLIHAYSEQGQGTTFKIYLPRYVDDTKVERVERQDVLMLGYGETVLLVEDEPAILEVSKAMLDILGYTLLASNSPREALQLAARHSGAIDLLITDVIMPEMNGLDLSIQLRTLIPGLETIYISGYPASVIAQKGVLQVENYIQKPFSMKDLAAKIRTVLAKSNKRVM